MSTPSLADKDYPLKRRLPAPGDGAGSHIENVDSGELLDRFHLASVPSPSGVNHLLFWHR